MYASPCCPVSCLRQLTVVSFVCFCMSAFGISAVQLPPGSGKGGGRPALGMPPQRQQVIVLASGVSVSALVPAAVTCAPVDEAQVAVHGRHHGVELGVAPRDQRRLLRLQPATMVEIQRTLVRLNCITIWHAAPHAQRQQSRDS